MRTNYVRTMLGGPMSAIVLLSVPVLALLALTPWGATSQARDQSLLAEVATDDADSQPTSTDDTEGDSELISDLSDWSYTANPNSPKSKKSKKSRKHHKGKRQFDRRLLSGDPGQHATNGGANPKVPWKARAASSGGPQQSGFGPRSFSMAAAGGPGGAADPANQGSNVENPERFNTPSPPGSPQDAGSVPASNFLPDQFNWRVKAKRLGRAKASQD